MTRFSFDATSKTLTCAPSGRMDSATSPALDLEEQVGGQAPLAVIVDLGKVGYVSSAFLRTCVATAKKLPAGGFRVTRTSPALKQIFLIAGLDKLFPVE
jgi:anti-anti-sigma factor